MNLKFLKIVYELRTSYWFLPSMMAIGAVMLSVGTIFIDLHLGMEWSDKLLKEFSDKPDGARAILSTVAGSMITVAGVTFSLTILAVSHASSQYGPRIVTNFMGDRTNQVTLGTFIATFLYCLLVLRTVRSADESTGGSGNELLGAFVPHISILIAILLTMVSVAVLIMYFHHIPESIRLSNVVGQIGRQLHAKIEELFPQNIGDAPPEKDSETQEQERWLQEQGAYSVSYGLSPFDAYIQAIDSKRIVGVASDCDVIVELTLRPGTFVSQGSPLFKVWRNRELKEEAQNQQKTHKKIADCFVHGSERTANQDLMYLLDQLIEVAARALSPGVNDPYTAMNAMDWIESGLILLFKKSPPSNLRYDNEGALRVVAPNLPFMEVQKLVNNRLRPYVSTDPMAALHWMHILVNLERSLKNADQIESIKKQMDGLLEACSSCKMFTYDMEALKNKAQGVPN